MRNLIPYNLFEMAKYSEEDIKNLVKNFLIFVYAPAQQSEFKKIYERFGKEYDAISFGNEGFNKYLFDDTFNIERATEFFYEDYYNRIFNLNSNSNFYANHGNMSVIVALIFTEEHIELEIYKNRYKNVETRLIKEYYYYKLEHPNKFFDEIIKQINFFL
jgi:hypothetical protein